MVAVNHRKATNGRSLDSPYFYWRTARCGTSAESAENAPIPLGVRGVGSSNLPVPTNRFPVSPFTISIFSSRA